MAIEIVDFPMKHGGSFQRYVKVSQRVDHYSCYWVHGKKTDTLSEPGCIVRTTSALMNPCYLIRGVRPRQCNVSPCFSMVHQHANCLMVDMSNENLIGGFRQAFTFPRSIFYGHCSLYNPTVVFWYQWDYPRSPAKFFFPGYLQLWPFMNYDWLFLWSYTLFFNGVISVLMTGITRAKTVRLAMFHSTR